MLTMYRARLRPVSSFIFSWHADSLFGAMCQAIRFTDGQKSLEDFLNLYRTGRPPVVLSNGYLGDWLPRPYLPPHPPEVDRPRKEMIQRAQARKSIKDRTLISLEAFNKILAGGEPDLTSEETSSSVPWITEASYHNMVNRLTGTTGNEGSLYTVSETFADTYISVYLYVEPGWDTKVKDWLEVMGRTGVGQHRSWGKGGFRVLEFAAFHGFVRPSHPNALISLSNFVPSASDPTEGFYRTLVKYGKVDPMLSTGGNPFKYSLLMFAAGSMFYTGREPKQFYGRLVEGISPAHPEVVQYGLALAVPAQVPSAS